MSLLDLNKRKQNIHNAFTIIPEADIKARIIGLVDDVATTGATIFEAAKILKENGAKEVWGIVLARPQACKPLVARIAFPHTAR